MMTKRAAPMNQSSRLIPRRSVAMSSNVVGSWLRSAARNASLSGLGLLTGEA